MSTDVAHRFAAALEQLESSGDADALVSLYAERSEIGNVLDANSHRGPDGARQFWETYRRQFGEVASSFRSIVESDGAAALEWHTEGTINAQPVEYAGVTVLEITEDGITRSCAYFDPAALGRQIALEGD